MIFKSKKYILMDQKVHYKMHKSTKGWLVTGITTFGLCLGLGIPATLVKAETQPVQTANKKATPKPQQPQANIATSNLVSGGASKDYFSGISENYSTAPSFSQEFQNQKLTSVPRKTGYIKAGTDNTGKLQLRYYNGSTYNTDLINQTSGGSPHGNEIFTSNDPLFMIPAFSIIKGNGDEMSWIYSNGGGNTSAPFFVGINNDWKTADAGTNWRFWKIEQSPEELNSTITLKVTGDFTFKTNRTYTLDFTITLKPDGSNVDYNVAIRNVTALVNPNITPEQAALPNFWMGTQYDTKLGGNDAVPIYYTGENQGLYLKDNGYKLSFNFTSKNAPTGWGALSYGGSYRDIGINSPVDLGQKALNKPADTVAYRGGDSALYLVWTGKNLANGDTREANYQASISSDSAQKPKVTLNEHTKNYTGKALTVAGTASYPTNDPEALPLRYYYSIDRGPRVEFTGPVISGTTPQPFSFTVPEGAMVPGDEHSISVYAVDAYGTSAETEYLKLTAHAEIKAQNKTYYTGETFDEKANFISGEQVNGDPLTYGDLTETVIKNHATGQVVPKANWSQITSQPGEYDITYTYKFGTKGGDESKTTKIYVVARKHITLNYVDQHHQPIDPRLLADLPDGIKSGTHDGAYGSKFNLVKKDELSLEGKKYYDFVKFEAANPATVINDNQLVFGDQDQAINVVYQGVKIEDNDSNAQSRITVHHYLKDSNPKVKVKDDTYKGGYIGDSVTVAPSDPEQAVPGYSIVPNQAPVSWTLKPGEGKEVEYYYTGNPQNNIKIHFVNAKTGNEVRDVATPEGKTGGELNLQPDGDYLPREIPKGYHYAKETELEGKKQPGNLTYTTQPQEETVYVAGDEVNDTTNAKSRITVHHYLKGTTTDVPGMRDTYVGGYIGDPVTISKDGDDQKAPAGYTIEAEPKEYKRELTYKGAEDQSQEVAFYYTANPQNNIKIHFINAKTDKEVRDVATPEGKTGDKLNLQPDGDYLPREIPKGYHYAKETELEGKKQPGNLTYTTQPQEETVYVAGDEVNDTTNAKSRITVHHYLKGTTTDVPGMRDTYVGGYIEKKVTISKDDDDQKAPAGYTIEAEPKEYERELTYKGAADPSQEVTFYYTADPQSNITVHFFNARNNKEVASYVPQGHVTGDTLDLTAQNHELITKIPEGYHYASAGDLAGKTDENGVQLQQPTSQSYKPNPSESEKNPKVYVLGEEVNDTTNAKSRITVHHYLKGTTTDVPGMQDTYVGGYIGDEVTISKTGSDQQAPAGYTIEAEPEEYKRDLTYKGAADQSQEVTFYYTANPQNNIEVHFVNARNNKEVASYVPQGHVTGDTLDLTAQNQELITKIPEGYHYASADDLDGKTDASGAPLKQPTSRTYQPNPSESEKNPKVYVVGEKVDDKTNSRSRITVHHYLQKASPNEPGNTNVPGMTDTYIGGFIGDVITVAPTDPNQEAPTGYSIVPNQPSVTWKLKKDEGKEVTFYYTADPLENITVNYIDANTGENVFSDKPRGYHTGDTLDLSENGKGINLPAGYHFAKENELKDKTDAIGRPLVQPTNPTYTPASQVRNVYVIGNTVAPNATNAVTVHHYLENSTTPVPGMSDIHRGGRVGQTLVFKPTDPEQQAPLGYTLVTQTDQTWKLDATQAGDLKFYYRAIDLSNVTVKFVNAKNGKEIKTDYPIGQNGQELNLTDTSANSYLKATMPDGYHYATGSELKAGQKQPNNLTYTTKPQTATVYVYGDEVTNGVTVHHYLEGTTTKVDGLNDITRGGNVGDELVFKPTDPEQKAPEGYTLVTQTDQKYTIVKDSEGEVNFYYKANELANIEVQFINVKNNKCILTDTPKGHKLGDTLALDSNSDYIKSFFAPEGKLKNYAYATNLGSGQSQPTSPLTYSLTPQTPKVYVTPPAETKVKVKFVNINSLNDPIPDIEEVGQPGDVVTKEDLAIPSGYALANSTTLNNRGFKQLAEVAFPIEGEADYVVYVEQAFKTVTIKHVYKLGGTEIFVPRMSNVVQTYRVEDDLIINTNLGAHRAPSGYRISRQQPGAISFVNGIMKVDKTKISSSSISIYYDRLR